MAKNRPHLHERNGRYHARKVIPVALRPYFDGQREFSEALGADRRAALMKLPIALARFETKLAKARLQLQAETANAKSGDRAIYSMTIDQMAVAQYAIELDKDMKEREFEDRESITDMAWSRPAFRQDLIRVAAGVANAEEMDALVGWAIEAFNERGNHTYKRGSREWRKLAMELAAAQLEVVGRQNERDQGNFIGQPVHPTLVKADFAKDQKPPVSIIGLFDSYMKEREADGTGHASRKRWTPVFERLVKTVGHDDANRLTKKALIAWRDELSASGLKTKTVKSVHLASVKAVLRWAHGNDYIDQDPSALITMRNDRKAVTRERGFTDSEADAILKCAKTYKRTGKETQKVADAKRWVPWICAFTGARVGEIAQLRKQDVFERDGITAIRITPEAGTVKTNAYRDVPLHTQIIDDGFLDFVTGSSSGHLFVDGTRGQVPKTAAHNVQIRIREWLRKEGLIPEGVQPNHAWRHRFKTMGREFGIDSRVLDAIQGHAARTAGDSYGDVTLKAMKRVIDELPCLAM